MVLPSQLGGIAGGCKGLRVSAARPYRPRNQASPPLRLSVLQLPDNIGRVFILLSCPSRVVGETFNTTLPDL